MANVITGRQWKIDTAGTIWVGNAKIEQIEFTNYAADTDVFVVTDIAGRIVWEGNGAADLSPVRSGKIGWVDGLKVTTLTTGAILLVYIH